MGVARRRIKPLEFDAASTEARERKQKMPNATANARTERQPQPQPQPPATGNNFELMDAPKPDEGWREVAAPEIIKWEKPGERLAGVLIQIAKVNIDNRPVIQYTLALGERRFKFLGSFDLTQKITQGMIGCQMRTQYLGQDRSITGGPNNTPMKVFSVQVKGSVDNTKVTEQHPITDEDIPF
jgi:hypothetical protein